MKPLSFGVAYRHVHFPSRAVEPRTTRKPASERTPGLQKAAREGPQSAHLRHLRPQSATGALRRPELLAVRKYRSFADGAANGSNRPEGDIRASFR